MFVKHYLISNYLNDQPRQVLLAVYDPLNDLLAIVCSTTIAIMP